jgi:hypothetical protein
MKKAEDASSTAWSTVENPGRLCWNVCTCLFPFPVFTLVLLLVLTTLAINTDPLRARAAALHTAAYLTHALTECLASWVTSMRRDADLRDSMRSDC